MDLIETAENTADVKVSIDELLILNNSLNEVCHGLDQFEFETRMGASHEDVKGLLKKVGSIIDELEKSGR
ncbi:hypothetical protein [Sessilibacter corallicola]|uniref:hypothetical protein n=1 Tax=Sessilibacter corallicola TaxID=2904075 RepID=UPI001E41849C|nr:hypothetical protein [Sessilibacter corallicola]MCE2029935.1 hypothetical protein [Sessilibacter corallicola]